MPLLESDAIILKTYPLGEADRIVAFFSRDHGKVRGVANGARKMKNRFGASLEPLAHSRIQFFERENRDLVRIQSAEILDSPMALFSDYDRAVFAAQVVELTDRFLPAHAAPSAGETKGPRSSGPAAGNQAPEGPVCTRSAFGGEHRTNGGPLPLLAARRVICDLQW